MKNNIVKIDPFYSELDTLTRITPVKILAYLIAFAAIEFQAVWVEPKLSTFYYGFILVILLHHYLFANADPNRYKLLLLSAIPLLRLISMAMPVGLVEPLYRYPMVGIPVFVSVALILRETALPWSQLGLQLPPIQRTEQVWENILIALSGIPLGIMGYYFADPIPLVTTLNWPEIFASLLVVILYVALLEEIVFRGMLLHVLAHTFGLVGVVFSSIIYTALFSSYYTIEGIILMGVASLLYGWHVNESGSILPATISHTLMIAGMVIVWPIVF